MDPKHPDLPTRAEALLNQTDWVRKVVRGLGVDESSAEDVVQSTWVAALTTPPRAAELGPGFRAWIARVARNFALRRIDRDARRALRERDSAREERLPSTADVVEREEARAQVVRALLEVHEPFRTTLLLRFYEGLEPRDIARVQKVPDSTVRNRLKRGLALLRERLEISQGPNWRQRCLLVLPALRVKPFWLPSLPKSIAATAASGGAVVIKAVGIAALVTVAAGGVYLAWDHVESARVARAEAERSAGTFGSSGSSSARGGSASHERASSAPSQLVAASPHSTRAPVADGAGSSESGGATDPVDDGHRFALHGRLLSPDGKPLKPEAASSMLTTILDRRIGVALSGLTVSGSGGEGGGTAGAEQLEIKEQPAVELKDDIRGEKDRIIASKIFVSRDAPSGGEAGSEKGGEQFVFTTAQGMEGVPQIELSTGGAQTIDSFFLGASVDTARPPHVLVASTSGDAREADIDAQGNFEFGDLRPDHWHLLATAPGYVSRRMEFEVGREEKEKHLDVTLTPSPDLRVKVVTPEGKDLFQAVIDDPTLAGNFVPVPFAMREGPGSRIVDLGENPSQPFASGRWQRHENEEDKSAGDASGVLKLTDALPLHVGISVRGVVLDQRLVPIGSDEVVFVVPLDRLRALVSGVTVRLVSSRDGLPIAGANVEVEGLEAVATNAQGEATLDGVPPGSHRITFEAQGVERRQEWIEVEPGAKNDLGVRQLAPALRITGRVVDENGAPVQVTVRLGELDAQVPGHSLPTADAVDSGADGRFVFERAGRGRYLVSIEGGDRAAPVTTVDTRQGEVPEVVVQTSTFNEVKLTFPIEPPPGSRYVVETTDGIPVAVEPVEGWQPLVVRLGHGEYRAKIVSNGRTLWTRHVIVQPDRMVAFDEGEARK